MKKNTFNNLKTLIITIILVTLTGMVDLLPWWSFVIPVAILGMFVSFRTWKVSGFRIGFLSGFIIWVGVNVYFDLAFNGIILNKISLLLTLPKLVVILISGVIGGMLVGLALYTGQMIITNTKIFNLDEKIN